MQIWDFFKKGLNLSNDELIKKLANIARLENLKKGQLLIEEGEPQTKIPFLLRGILRGFLVDAEGREITDCFAYHPRDIVMGCNQLGEPSKISIEAIIDTELLSLPAAPCMELLEEYPELVKLHNSYLLEALGRHWEEKILMHRCSAANRYQWFLNTYPGLINHISNKYIASFLGITPVSLSRIRRSLREDKNSQNEETPAAAAAFNVYGNNKGLL